MIKPRQLGIYMILLNGDYNFLKWNKTLLMFGYRVDVIALDEFERRFAGLFEMSGLDADQNFPISFIDGTQSYRTIYISREFYDRIINHYPQYIPILEAGYVVLLKTFQKLRLTYEEEPQPAEIVACLRKTHLFFENFKNCLQLTIGDSLNPGGLFGHVSDANKGFRYRLNKKAKLIEKIELDRKGYYFLLDFPG